MVVGEAPRLEQTALSVPQVWGMFRHRPFLPCCLFLHPCLLLFLHPCLVASFCLCTPHHLPASFPWLHASLTTSRPPSPPPRLCFCTPHHLSAFLPSLHAPLVALSTFPSSMPFPWFAASGHTSSPLSVPPLLPPLSPCLENGKGRKLDGFPRAFATLLALSQQCGLYSPPRECCWPIQPNFGLLASTAIRNL